MKTGIKSVLVLFSVLFLFQIATTVSATSYVHDYPTYEQSNSGKSGSGACIVSTSGLLRVKSIYTGFAWCEVGGDYKPNFGLYTTYKVTFTGVLDAYVYSAFGSWAWIHIELLMIDYTGTILDQEIVYSRGVSLWSWGGIEVDETFTEGEEVAYLTVDNNDYDAIYFAVRVFCEDVGNGRVVRDYGSTDYARLTVTSIGSMLD